MREASSPTTISSSSRAEAAASSERAGNSAPHVLVADDPRTTGALAWLLREQGYQVTSVSEQLRLMDALERVRPDLVLVDMDHFGTDG